MGPSYAGDAGGGRQAREGLPRTCSMVLCALCAYSKIPLVEFVLRRGARGMVNLEMRFVLKKKLARLRDYEGRQQTC
jgi:hypothetical protein